MNTLLYILIANGIISTLSLIGVFFLKKSAYVKKIMQYFVSFAAGVMLATSFFNILPEALEDSDINFVLAATLAGIVFSFFVERFLFWFHCHHGYKHPIAPSAFLVIFGDGIHNFIDGIAIAATFLVSHALGIITTFVIATHEIPQELADFSILVHSGMKKKRALWLNFLSALTAVIGGIVGFFFLQQFESGLPSILAFTAGIFIYIANADLIPELHRESKKDETYSQSIPFLIGIILIFLISYFSAHSHG